jgi:hypothetical protein
MVFQEILSQAVRAAKEGRRDEARALLLRVVAQDPNNPTAWVWLADQTEDLHGKAAALEKALALRPGHPALQARLHHIRKEIGKGKPGDEGQQNASYAQMITVDPLLKTVDRLRADPAPSKEPEPSSKPGADLWLRARHFEELGEFEQAVSAYLTIATHSRSAAERVEANHRIAALKLRQESDQITAVHPTLNLVRLAAGPGLLFFLLVFIQSGLKLAAIGPLGLVSLAGVGTGGLLVAVTGLRPLHPVWVYIFGAPRSPGEAEARFLLRILGWLLVILPYGLFFFEASMRLMKLWAAVVILHP